jgi:hypothetical protein
VAWYGLILISGLPAGSVWFAWAALLHSRTTTLGLVKIIRGLLFLEAGKQG